MKVIGALCYVKLHLTFTLSYFQVSYTSFATSHEVHSKVINFPILAPIFHHFWLFLREKSKQRRKMLFSFRFGPPQGGPALIVSRLCNSIKVRWAPTAPQCSRNFQNVKLRLDFVEMWSFYCHYDFTWNQILVYSNGPKMSFLAISEALNFEFLVNLGLENCSNLLQSKFTTNCQKW